MLECKKAAFYERPYIGALPNGIITCDCCTEKVLLEVKCTKCVKHNLISKEKTGFCMEKVQGTERWTLCRDHAYFYQVQAQMEVCNVQYADFVVWTENEVLMERISCDKGFFEAQIPKVNHFFVYGILPELIGKWYTRQPVANKSGVVELADKLKPHTEGNDTDESQCDDQNGEDPDATWCYYGGPSHGKMVCCDNSECSIQWSHFKCLRIDSTPKEKWFCPSCAPKMNSKTKKKTLSPNRYEKLLCRNN